MNVLALDLSLASTGYVVMPIVAPNAARGGTISVKTVGPQRLVFIRDAILGMFDEQIAEVAIEGLAFGAPDTNFERAGLAWIVKLSLFERGTPYWDVPPATLKKFVTGKGNAKKEDMKLHVFKRWGFEHASNDVVDAYGLARGLRNHLLGGHERISDTEAWAKERRMPALEKARAA